MITNICRKAAGVLHNPAGTFRNLKDDPFRDTVTYYLVLFALNLVLSAAITFSMNEMDMKALGPGGISLLGKAIIAIGYVGFFRALFFGTVGLVVFSVLFHLPVYLAGGRKGLKTTFSVVMYSLTPLLLAGWIFNLLLLSLSRLAESGGSSDLGLILAIPLVILLSLLFMFVYTMVLLYHGTKEMHELSSERAFGVVGITAAALFVLAFFFMIFLFVASSWGAGTVNFMESMAPPIKFSLERTNDKVLLKNTGIRTVNPIRLDEITRLEVTLFGVPNGTIGTATGSVLPLISPSCPADIGITAVYRNGTRGKIAAISDGKCLNDITDITI